MYPEQYALVRSLRAWLIAVCVATILGAMLIVAAIGVGFRSLASTIENAERLAAYRRYFRALEAVDAENQHVPPPRFDSHAGTQVRSDELGWERVSETTAARRRMTE